MTRARLHRKLFASYLAVIAVAAVAAVVLVVRWAEPGASAAGVRAILAGTVVGIAVALGFAWRAARRVAQPVRELAQAAREIAEGRFVAPPAKVDDDEVGELQEAIAALSRRLAETVRTLTTDGARLRSVLDGMSEGVALVERGRIALANPAFARLLDVQGPIEGRTPLEAARSSDLAKAIAQAGAAAPAGGARDVDGPRGKVLHLRAEPLGSGAVVVVLLDVTVARSLERMRREFVANASHELRTPVAAIRAVVETLFQTPDLDAASRTRFEGVLTSHVERLSRLVNDLLDLSDAEAGARGAPVRIAVAEPLGLSLATVRPRAEKKRLRIEEALPADLPPIEADATAVEQVLTNLLDNAVKYTPDGGRIQVRAAAVEGMVRIEVEDNGAGIPAQHLPRLFERFYRVDPARSRALGGTGLGLAIVKHLVQANGGEVGVTSKPGSGSIFRVSFPKAR